MVEIRYGEQYEVVNLAGQTVSEAREQFRDEFGIPDKARAKLNGRKVKGGGEPDMVLNDDDKLSFAVAKSKGPYLVGALLLALAVTGGVFAATAASDTITIGVTAVSDIAQVAKETGSPPSWTVFGRYKGSILNARMFTITPDTAFTGDVLTSLYITNGNDLAKVYKALVMKIEVFDANLTQVAGPEYLTLEGSELSLAFTQASHTSPYSVNVTSGYFSCFRWIAVPTNNEQKPIIFCEVTQASP